METTPTDQTVATPRKRKRMPGSRRRIARAVKRLRLERKWSQEDLAKKSGYTRSAISLIEKASRAVSPPGRIALAQAFGMSGEAFLAYAASGTDSK